ncbi:MAG TPA: hypothetical protein PLO37_24575 [Candidatus Hydrogenedentes bacterium]|nr:hypothetical protein [Candidatus Hydrogenedentota bacterium]HPG70037.1 hypothetical protein [Candidatus Hydrogenedentota bacterium]
MTTDGTDDMAQPSRNQTFILGEAVYAVAAVRVAALIVELCIGAIITVGLVWRTWSRPRGRVWAVWAASALVVLGGLLIRAEHSRGDNSPKRIAQVAGDLVRAGYRVEACKVYPAFAFYAGVPLPVQTDLATVAAALNGDEPYYYVLLQRFTQALDLRVP